MTIKVVPLGAGQDVGRSCILLSINNKNIMLDCGMHMGYHVRRYYSNHCVSLIAQSLVINYLKCLAYSDH